MEQRTLQVPPLNLQITKRSWVRFGHVGGSNSSYLWPLFCRIMSNISTAFRISSYSDFDVLLSASHWELGLWIYNLMVTFDDASSHPSLGCVWLLELKSRVGFVFPWSDLITIYKKKKKHFSNRRVTQNIFVRCLIFICMHVTSWEHFRKKEI